MTSEPDVFKKLDALLNKHKNGEPIVPVKPSSEDAIPTLMDAIEDDAESIIPVLTEIVAGPVEDPISEELELDLEFIPEDVVEAAPEPVLSAELPDVWAENEHEFDAETTHGFGLSAFARDAASTDSMAEVTAVSGDTRDATVERSDDEPAPFVENGLDEAEPAPSGVANGEPDVGDAADDIIAQAPASSSTTAIEITEQDTSGDQIFAQTGGPDVAPDSADPFAAHDDPESKRSESAASEFAFNDTLTERALRDLDRHVATILERQVGPQLAKRLDHALASMLDQFSVNLESLVREAVRDEMRRYFDGDNQ